MVAPQQQKAQQPFDGESREPHTHQRRYFGLVYSKNCSGVRLRQPPFVDNGNNFLRQLSFGQSFIRLRKAKIGKDVSRALYIIAFRHVHFSCAAFNFVARLSRRLTSSISALGVAIPVFDFF